MMDTIDIVLGPGVSERKGAENKKIVNLELTNNSRRKPTTIGGSSRSNDQIYGRTNLVRTYVYPLDLLESSITVGFLLELLVNSKLTILLFWLLLASA